MYSLKRSVLVELAGHRTHVHHRRSAQHGIGVRRGLTKGTGSSRDGGQVDAVSAQSTMSPRSSLFLFLFSHVAHPPLHPTIRDFWRLVLLGAARSIGMQRGGSARTSRKLILLSLVVIVEIDVVALEVLILRGKLGSVEVVVDVRVGLFLQGSPVVWTCTALSQGLVEAGLG